MNSESSREEKYRDIVGDSKQRKLRLSHNSQRTGGLKKSNGDDKKSYELKERGGAGTLLQNLVDSSTYTRSKGEDVPFHPQNA